MPESYEIAQHEMLRPRAAIRPLQQQILWCQLA